MVIAKLRSLHRDSLVRNSFYLMLTTVVVSGFGFFFWVISAHLFSTEEIGLATALISAFNLIAILSLLGFNTVFIRFLSKSDRPNRDISTGLILVGLAAFAFSLIFIVFVDFFSPKLAFAQQPIAALAFVVFCIFAALNQLLESVFLAYRSTVYVLIGSTLHSAAKMLFPLLFIGQGAIGVFIAASLSQVIGFAFAFIVLAKKFNFRPHPAISKKLLSKTWQFSSINYTAAVFNLLPISVLPIIITNRLGAEETAYFYVSMMLGNLLYVIPWSAAKSLFAEGSHDEYEISSHIKKVIKIDLSLLLPAIIFVLLFGRLLLSVFGEDYATDGTHFLWLVALAGIPIAVNSTFGALLQIKKDPKSLVITNVFYGLTLIGLTYVFLPQGLSGVGFAWILGSTAAATVSGLSYFFGDWFYERLFMGTYVYRDIVTLKLKSFFQYVKNGFTRKTILFYPEKPKWYHTLYVIMHVRGYRITNDPTKKYDAAFSFQDVTVKPESDTLTQLRSKSRLINGHCMDLSKNKVNEVFAQVFGYDLGVDPKTHIGACVQKSDTNATHDGKVISCPAEPLPGYTYQKLIDNTYQDDKVRDIRVFICGDTIPFVIHRFRSLSDRFDNTQRIELGETNDTFSPKEVEKILAFTKAFHLDYGELDILRDNQDGRLYIVDANLTCGGPISGKHLTRRQYRVFIQRLATCFDKTFLSV